MTPPLTSIYTTFIASLHSIGTAVTLAAVGVYLHRQDFISNEGKRTLALLSQQITFPLYLFTKILYCNQDWSDSQCPDVTNSLRDVWLLALWPIYVVGSGILVGCLVARWTNTPAKKVRAVIAACAFGNSTGLPITLLAVIHANFPKTSDLGSIDPSLFLSVYLLLYPGLQWGIGGWMLAPDSDDVKDDNQICKDEENQSLLTKNTSRGVSSRLRHNVLNNTTVTDYYNHQRRGLSSADEGLYISEMNLTGLHEQEYESERLKESQRLIVISHGEENDEQTQDYSNDQSKETTNPITLPSTGTWHTHSQKYYGTNDRSQDTDSSNPVNASAYSEKDSILHKENKFDAETVWQSVRNVWGRCFQPPVVGSILGIIAAVTPVRGYFVDLVDRSSHAPLQWMFDGLYSVGLTAVPINMIILGCNLSSSYKSSKTEDPSMNLNDGLFTMKTSIGIVIGKMLVLPIIGISSALLLKNYLWVISEDIDDSFYIVIMIVFLCPTANNVMVMVELSGSNAKEGIARVIAMQYAVAPLILSLTMTISIGVASSWS